MQQYLISLYLDENNDQKETNDLNEKLELHDHKESKVFKVFNEKHDHKERQEKQGTE